MTCLIERKVQFARQNYTHDWVQKKHNLASNCLKGHPGGKWTKTNWAAEGKGTTEGKEIDALLGGRRRNRRDKVAMVIHKDSRGYSQWYRQRRRENVHEGEEWDKAGMVESQTHRTHLTPRFKSQKSFWITDDVVKGKIQLMHSFIRQFNPK